MKFTLPRVFSSFSCLLLAGCPAPEAGGVLSLYPEAPDTTDTLVVVMAEATAAHRFSWTRDDEAVEELTEGFVPPEYTSRGEVWAVTAEPVDGFEGASQQASVTIGNAAPTVNVTLSPVSPGSSDDLVAVATVSDADGDPVSLVWQWSVDGALRVGLTEDTVQSSETGFGEVWSVVVTPEDDSSAGEPAEASVEIGNAAPLITSATLDPSEAYTDTTLTVTATATDADGDESTIVVDWFVDGVSIGLSGEDLSPDETMRGDLVSAQVSATDGMSTGAAVSVGPIEILNTAPSAPEIALEADGLKADLICEIVLPGEDIDADPVLYDISWTLDGKPWTGKVMSTYRTDDTIVKGDLSSEQEWTCTVSATDGDASSEPVTATTSLLPDNVTYRSGYYWVRATYGASASDHGAICASAGLTATSAEVSLTWDETLLSDLAEDFGYVSVGDANNSAQSMWCYDKGSSYPPGLYEGACETHNFGSSYNNYGTWGYTDNQRPVFTCTK